jgi:hypothetical protein
MRKYYRVKEERNIIHTIKGRMADWTGHTLRRNCFLSHLIEGNTERGIYVMGRRRRRSKQLLYDRKETKGYWKLKEEPLGRTSLRIRFGRGRGQTAE